MCDGGVFSVPIALAIVSAVSASDAQRKQAHAADDAYKANYAAATDATKVQQGEIVAQSTDQIQARARQATIEQARLRAAALSNGISGPSVDAAVNEASFNEGTDIASINANKEAQLRQSAMNLQGVYNKTVSGSAMQQRPSAIGAGLQIAGTAADTYSKYKSTQPAPAPKPEPKFSTGYYGQF